MDYYKTYAPVVKWFAIRLMIIFRILFSLSLRQAGFITTYPQLLLELTSAWNFHKVSILPKRQKQGSEYLVNKMTSIDFK